MKKAILVEYSFITRLVLDDADENFEYILNATKDEIQRKVTDELGENLFEWYDDTEMPFDENEEMSH